MDLTDHFCCTDSELFNVVLIILLLLLCENMIKNWGQNKEKVKLSSKTHKEPVLINIHNLKVLVWNVYNCGRLWNLHTSVFILQFMTV